MLIRYKKDLCEILWMNYYFSMQSVASWNKVNTNDVANGAHLTGDGGIFCTSWGFVKRCFYIHLGVKFAYVAELLAVIHALETAQRFA